MIYKIIISNKNHIGDSNTEISNVFQELSNYSWFFKWMPY